MLPMQLSHLNSLRHLSHLVAPSQAAAAAGGGGDTTPPTFSAWSIDAAGTTLSATLSESGCVIGSATGGGDIVLTGTSAAPAVASGTIVGTAYSCPLSPAAANGQTITIAFSADVVRDAAGNQNAESSGAVTNNVPAFAPTDIPGLKLWLKPESIVGAGSLADTDPVVTWGDASGNSNTAFQSDAGKRPQYRTGQINGLAAASFDGVDDLMALASSLSAAGAFTVIAVQRRASIGENMVALSSIGSDQPYSPFEYVDNNIYFSNGTSGAHSVAPSIDFHRVAGVSTGSAEELYVDGSSVVSDSSAGAGSFDTVGGRGGGGNERAHGEIAEILFYDSALSPTDRAAVESYLSTKYAL